MLHHTESEINHRRRLSGAREACNGGFSLTDRLASAQRFM
jgi:hypothetical protein